MRWLPMVLLPGLLAAQLTTSSYWQWRTVASPEITADGRAVVYAQSWNDPQTDASYSNLWMVDVTGSETRPLTTGNWTDSAPRVAPDGTRVAFVTNRSGSRQIHVRWLDGRNEAQVTRADPSPSSDFAWSPDGRWIAYTARVPAEPGFHLVNGPKPPKGAKWAMGPSVITKLRWRADKTPGQGLVPDGDAHLFVIPSDGGAPRQLTRAGFHVTGAPS